MDRDPFPRLDDPHAAPLRAHLLGYCRLRPGEIWTDPRGGHRVGCLDAGNPRHVQRLMAGRRANLAVHDPPYNLAAFERQATPAYIAWCRKWIAATARHSAADAALYVWLGADQCDGFQPLPDFMVMMRRTPFAPRSFITMRNQRGYGTPKNWMAVRQELLYYTKGSPGFCVEAEYTAIPKILRGYYKTVAGKRTENLERSGARTLRAGNVWVDIQQVFYRMEENVNGCYAQKPLAALERILGASSRRGEVVIDWFAHAGTTLLAAERVGRTCLTMDIDPVFCEITIRRLERWRTMGKTGWQASHPFAQEAAEDPVLAQLCQKREATTQAGVR